MYLHDPNVPVAVTALRGDQTLQFQVGAVSADDRDYADISIDPIESLIPEFGIFGKTVFATTARTDDSGLAPGDVIASLNGTPVASTQELRGAIQELTDGKPAVVEIERNGLFSISNGKWKREPF